MSRPLSLLLVVFILVNVASAEPQYSAIFGQSCFLCHSNPQGRAMRSLYGSQFFAPTYLTYKPVKFELLQKINPSLSEAVTIGADLRTIFLTSNTQSDTVSTGLSAPLSTNTGGMAQMEGYLYLSLQPTDKLAINWSQGVSSFSGRFEVYGIANVLPFNGYLKAGQFQESFGWNLTDHTSFVRTGLFTGYDGTPTNVNRNKSTPTPPGYGVGGEIGFRPWKFDVSASFANPQTIAPTGYDMQKRWMTRAVFKQGVQKLKLQFSVGGSWFLAPFKAADPQVPAFFPEQKRNEAWGGFAGIGWQGIKDKFGCHDGFGFLATSLLFEYDRNATWQSLSDSTVYVTKAFSTTQLSVQVQPGVWLTGAYDWLDNGYQMLGSDSLHTPLGREAQRTTLGL
jgi:hypothetical protein